MKNIISIQFIAVILFIAACAAFAGASSNLPDGELLMGKYGCTASKYRGGTVEYIPRGSFIITSNGKYTYNGFETPSSGTYSVDSSGNLLFKGGYLDGGKAESIDRPHKFFLVFPTIPDNRWTCGYVDNK